MGEININCPNCGWDLEETIMTQAKIEAEALNKENGKKLLLAKNEITKKAQEEIAKINSANEELRKQIQSTQARELELLQANRELKDSATNVELEIERRMATLRDSVAAKAVRETEERLALGVLTKDKKIQELTDKVTDLQRTISQGSQQTQGEVLELLLENTLNQLFPSDTITPVEKGVRGADVTQVVISGGKICGKIIWESKNTKHWNQAWIAKLKEDQVNAGAHVACLLTEAMPSDSRFNVIDGVFVTDRSHLQAVAHILRYSLIEVDNTKISQAGIETKKDLLYQYCQSPEFRGRVENVVNTFREMQTQLEKEKTAMTKHWATRATQIEKLILGTTHIYGGLFGIMGNDLPEIPILELE